MFDLKRSEEERAEQLHEKSIIIDLCAVPPSIYSRSYRKLIDECYKGLRPIRDFYSPPREIARKMERELFTDPELRAQYKEAIKKSGLTAMSETVGTSSKRTDSIFGFEGAIEGLAGVHLMIDKYREALTLATCTEDVRNAKSNGKVALMPNFQSSHHIMDNIDNIDLFYALGVRQMQLTHNVRTLAGDGAQERTDAGLSDFGVAIIERMDELGMIVDVGHCGHNTTMDAMEASKNPVIFSHACCRTLCDHRRNKTDEEIKAMAEKAGVIGIAFPPIFLRKKGRATINDFLDHLDHAVKLVGDDYISIGTDWGIYIPENLKEKLETLSRKFYKDIGLKEGFFPAWTDIVEGYESLSDFPNITRGLVSRGYSDQEIKKILGENYLRVLKRVTK